MLGSWGKELFEGNLEGWASTGQMIVVNPNLNRLVRIAVIESTSDCYFRCSKWYTWQHQVCFLSSLTNPIFEDTTWSIGSASWSSTVANWCFLQKWRKEWRPEQVPWGDLRRCVLLRYQWLEKWYQKEIRATLWNFESWTSLKEDQMTEPTENYSKRFSLVFLRKVWSQDEAWGSSNSVLWSGSADPDNIGPKKSNKIATTVQTKN